MAAPPSKNSAFNTYVGSMCTLYLFLFLLFPFFFLKDGRKVGKGGKRRRKRLGRGGNAGVYIKRRSGGEMESWITVQLAEIMSLARSRRALCRCARLSCPNG